MRLLIPASFILLAAAPASAEDPWMVIASTRAGRIQFFDASLAPIADIGVNQPLESLAVSPDGRRLYISQPSLENSGRCCGLFSLDLTTKRLCPITSAALFGIPSPDGRYLFTQSRRGVNIFDASTLAQIATLPAAGAYNLQPSPDGRWLFGLLNSDKPKLDIFDVKNRKLVRHVAVPASPAAGVWSGGRFYVFSYGDVGKGSLWAMSPEDAELTPQNPVPLPDFHGDCVQPVLLTLTGAPDRIFIAEAFGFNHDRRLSCPADAVGGVREFFPGSDNAFDLAFKVPVNRMVYNDANRELYILSPGDGSQGPRILQYEVSTQRPMHTVTLEPGEWNLTIARIPPALVPRHNVHAQSCSR